MPDVIAAFERMFRNLKFSPAMAGMDKMRVYADGETYRIREFVKKYAPKPQVIFLPAMTPFLETPMPHDANNQLLKVGDRVFLPCDVKAITSEGEDLCNVTLESVIGRKPDGVKLTIAGNAAQVVKEPDDGADAARIAELESRNKFLEGEVERLAKPANEAILGTTAVEPSTGHDVNCGCGKQYNTGTNSPQCPDHAPLASAPA